MHLKQINFFEQPATVACDGNCKKAWGISSRPEVQLSKDENDTAYLADGELGDAPEDPGTYEGGHAKPASAAEFPNKWCVRECERCAMTEPGKSDAIPTLRDFSQRVYNIQGRHLQ